MKKEFFKSSVHLTPFQKRISLCLNSPILTYRDLLGRAKILFTSNQVTALNGSLKIKSSSLQRRLLMSALYKLKPLVQESRLVIDVAGEKGLGGFFGIPENNFHTLNISQELRPTFAESAEGGCASVPIEYYDTALCVNYMLLAHSPGKVISNIHKFLKKDGFAIIDFVGLSYWYSASNGYHWHSYNPSSIDSLVRPFFSDFVIIPVGNWFQGACNYYSKRYGKNWALKKILFLLGKRLGRFDTLPTSAIHYLVVGKKS